MISLDLGHDFNHLLMDFGGDGGIFYGKITKYIPAARDENTGAIDREMFSVVYTDNDGEQMYLEEVEAAIEFAHAHPRR